MVDSENGFVILDHEIETGNGSCSNKKGRSKSRDEANWTSIKLAKKKRQIEKRNQRRQRSNPLSSSNHQPQKQMLGFSSPNPLINSFGHLLTCSLQRSLSSKIPPPYSYYQNRGMVGVYAGLTWPFTPNQWLELEQQVLIYKYMEAKLPVPSNLLISIRKELTPTIKSSNIWWRVNTMGFSSDTDPEPMRCRRTDGKKWRCSRNAVSTQKYCARHLNRGRHRSRKPVEGQTGQAASQPDTTTLVPRSNNNIPSSSVVAAGDVFNIRNVLENQVKSFQQGLVDLSANTQTYNRDFLNKANMGIQIQEPQVQSIVLPTVHLGPVNHSFAFPGQHNPFEEPFAGEFGTVPLDSLPNPSPRNSYISSQNFGSASDLTWPELQDPFSLFANEFSQNHSDFGSINLPDSSEIQTNPNQLPMSIPVRSDFPLVSFSPTHEGHDLSPMLLGDDFDPNHTGPEAGCFPNELTNLEENWNAFSCPTCTHGPLDIILNASRNSKNPGPNLMNAWGGSSSDGSSSTGVLPKTTSGSLFNSSTDNSPEAETSQTHEELTFYDDILGSTLFNSSYIPTI